MKTFKQIMLLFGLLFFSDHKIHAATLEGILSSSKECFLPVAEAFVSNDAKELLYQVSVPPNGSFIFHLKPGSYDLAIRGEKNCLTTKKIKISKSDESSKVEIKLEAQGRVPAAEAVPSCMCIRAPCDCGGLGGGGGFPSYWNNYSFPFWGYYGMQFPNFYYPGPWGYYPGGWGGGIIGGYYPGAGNIGLAKPVLYIDADPKSTFSLRVDFPTKPTDWLVTVPAYRDGWKLQAHPEGGVLSEGAHYPYVFYDLRTDDGPLQKKYGFCKTRSESIEKMSSILKKLNFKDSEVSDFTTYWNLKIPNLPEVCVFPQTEVELNQLAKLAIQPPIENITRILFVIMPYDGKYVPRGSFKEAPTESWQFPTKRKPAAGSAQVREWGVAFHMDASPQKEK